MKKFVDSLTISVRRSALSFGIIARDFFAGYYYYAYFFMKPSDRINAIF